MSTDSASAVLQEPEPTRQDAKARKRSAEELNVVYNDLVGYAFQHQDIQSALTAVQGSSLSDALDWLCMHVPPDRLPPRFAGVPPIVPFRSDFAPRFMGSGL